jgi:hypothetical protein
MSEHKCSNCNRENPEVLVRVQKRVGQVLHDEALCLSCIRSNPIYQTVKSDNVKSLASLFKEPLIYL